MARTLEDPRYIAIIRNLKAVRLRRGVTQQELANLLGRPQSFVAKTEGLERRLDVLEYLEICDALEISSS